MNKILLIIVFIPIIGSSQIKCEDSILDLAISNSELGINLYFQTALGLNLEELSFLQDCNSNINYTLFAPSENVPPESTSILFSLQGELIDYLSYYIYPETINFLEFSNGEIEMMDGNTVNISVLQTVDSYNVMLNQANITSTDICGCNGVIHIIDDLIWAPNINILEYNKASTYFHNNTLYLNKIEKNSYITINDMQGRIVLSSEINSSKINMSNLKRGIYSIKINNEENISTNKIFKN